MVRAVRASDRALTAIGESFDFLLAVTPINADAAWKEFSADRSKTPALHYRMLENWGFTKLAKKERAESIEEMHHADKLVARIIFLEGHPNLQTLAPLRIGQNVKEVLEADLAGEYDARTAYKKSRDICHDAGDYVSMKLFEELLADEEGHIDFLETQLDLVKDLGVQLYSQKHMGGIDADHPPKED